MLLHKDRANLAEYLHLSCTYVIYVDAFGTFYGVKNKCVP